MNFSDPPSTKQCKRCNLFFTFDNLSSQYNRKTGIVYYDSKCKPCKAIEGKIWREQRKVKLNYTQTEFERRLKSKYNLTFEQYNKMKEIQDFKCAICKQEVALQVDHNHTCCPSHRACGKCIRELLCHNCNIAVGAVKDNPEIALQIAKYLKKHSTS